MKYVLFASYMDWDKEKSKFVSPSIYRQWNAKYLLITMAWYPILLTIHLVNKYITHPNIFVATNSGKFTSYVLGWAENVLSLLCLTVGIWIQKNARILREILNQLSVYDAPITRKYLGNGQNSPLIREGERLALIISVLCLVVPFSFVSLLTLDSDETHMLIQEILEIDFKWKWEHAPFLIFMAWVASNAASIIFFGLMMNLLYIMPLIVNLNGLVPTAIFIDPNQDKKSGQKKKLVSTQGFGTLTESEYLRLLRFENLLNRRCGEIFESVLTTSHHVYCLAIFVVSSLIFIRAYDMLLESGILVLTIFMGGLAVPLLIEYQESTRLGQVTEASETLLKKANEFCRRGTHFHKFISSCRVLRLNLGYPFYNIDKYTFLEFVGQAANFIFTLLAL